MKKKHITPNLFLGLFFVLIASSISCEGETVDDLSTETVCNTTNDGCGGSFKTCANTTSIWYTYKGKTYTCASQSDCNAAATALAKAIAANCN
jgi:hypothetical protein